MRNYKAKFDGRNGFSKIDIDATFMHLKEEYVRNDQLKLVYILQFAVEGE